MRHIDRSWGTVALVAEDGQPLERSSSVLVVAMSRNRNTGMRVTPERLSGSDLWQQGMAQMCGVPGESPPIVDRIGGVIRAAWLSGMTCRRFDFARGLLSEETLDGTLVLDSAEPTFYARLTRPQPKIIKTMVVAGNSITRHPPLANSDWNNNWGMGASSEDKDFAHLVHRYLSEYQKSSPELMIENLFDPAIADPERRAKLADLKADLYIIQIGDNLKDDECNEETLGQPYEELLKAIKQANPKALIVCASTWGGSQNKDPLMRAAGGRQGVPFVRIDIFIGDPANRATNFTHGGVAWHPGDQGMQKIADALWAAIEPRLVE